MGIQLDRVINENYEKLNTVDQHILQFVQANLESCKKMNIADLARHCSVSTATILRTAQKLNFSGYSEFKYFLRSDSAENAEVLNLIEILNQDISQTGCSFLPLSLQSCGHSHQPSCRASSPRHRPHGPVFSNQIF